MKNRVPISELPSASIITEDHPLPLISWDFELPSVDTDRITVDEKYLRLIHKVGAISSTHVFSEQGEQSSFDYQINGINLNGTATMSGREIRTNTAQKERSDVYRPEDEINEYLLKNYGTTPTVHVLNKAEIARIVSDERYKTHQASEKIWAEQLDDVLQASIRSAARKHLLGRATKADITHEAIQWGLFGIMAGIGLAGNEAALDMVAPTVLLSRGYWLGYDSGQNSKLLGNSLLRERRFSLFQDVQPDRYVALDALTRVRRLIHYEK